MFGRYKRGIDPILIQCNSYEVENIMQQLNGAAGIDSVDTVQVKVYLVGYGRASLELREVMMEWLE